jgi:thiol-disulfide isomerase/thioredoxin
VLYIGVMLKAQSIAIMFTLFASVLMSAQEAAPPEQATNPQQVTPSLKLHDLKGGQHSLEDYRGKPVLLNFWATWCVPCAAEMPLLNEMQKQYQGRIVFIAASIDDEDMKPQVAAFIKKHQGEALTVMMGATLDSLDDFGVNQGMPGTVFIDAEGKIVDRITGALKRPDLEQQLRKLAGEPEPVPTPAHKAAKKNRDKLSAQKPGISAQEISRLHSRVAARTLHEKIYSSNYCFNARSDRDFHPV